MTDPVTLPEGLPQPSAHPDRYESLVIIGEVRDHPGTTFLSWKITPSNDPSCPRRLTEIDRDGTDPQHSRFIPMFGTDEEVRQLLRRYDELARLRADVKERRS